MVRLKLELLSVLVAMVCQLTVAAQYGGVDMSFNQLDDGTYGDGPLDYHLSYSGPSASVYEVFLLPDDRALIRGVFESYSGSTINGPVVILPDGTLDPSYSLSIPQSFYPGRVARANEGGFLCAGTVAGGHTIRPLSLDGTLSAPLQVLVNNVIQVMLQLPDDRILIGGSFTEVNGQPKVRMARLHADGTVDTSFDIGAGFNGYVQCLLPLPNGGVVVGGSFTTVDNVARNGLALLSADGTLDMDFDPMSSALYPCTIGNLVLDADGRLLVGGAFQLAGPTIWSNLGRFLMNGQRDPDFSPGSGPSNNVAVIVPMDDGRIMIGGSFQAYDGTPRTSIARLFADGQMDPSFDVHIGHTLTPIVNRIRFTLQGDMIVTGRFSAVDGRMRMAITRLSIDGVPDPGFLPGRGVGGMVFSMAHMDDGRVAIAGDHLSYNGQHRPYLSFLDPEGELDAAFSGGSGPNGRVTRMVKLPGDRLFLAGDMTRYDSVPVPRMAVVDAHGQLDMSMMLPDIVAPGLMVSALGVANDGGVYVAIMPEQTFSGHPPGLFKLFPNGLVDSAFVLPSNISGSIHAVHVLGDGRVLIGGKFNLPGSAAWGIARLMPDGSLDPSFMPGAGFGPMYQGSVATIVQRNDGRFIVGGNFSTYRGVASKCIACLEFDGTRCADFNTEGVTMVGSDAAIVWSLTVLPDDRTVVAGGFSTYGGAGIPHRGMAIAMPDGTPDPTFSVGSGPTYVSRPLIFHVLVDAEGRFVVSGSFNRFNGVPRHRIARLIGGGGVGITEASTTPALRAWPNPASDVLQLSEPFTGAVIDMQGRTMLEVARSRQVPVQQLAPGAYMLRSQEGYTVRFIRH